MRTTSISIAVLLWLSAVAQSQVEWHQSLYLANGGYWPLRLPVEIENTSGNAIAGEPAEVSISPLAGQPVSSLRACGADGVELLFLLKDATGRTRQSGQIARDDRLSIPVSCGANAKTVVYVYAGNEAAWPVPDFLPGVFTNGGFELGDSGPQGWRTSLADDQHRLSWGKASGRAGSCGVTAEVAEGASATWVQWQQADVPVRAGRSYRFTAWVRAENVRGSSGWYVHVNGPGRPQVINRTVSAGDGTYDWKQVTIEFTAPDDATDATFGTVLHGTGRASYDDAELVDLSDRTSLRVGCGELEQLRLQGIASTQLAPTSEWPGSCRVAVRNLSERTVKNSLVRVNLRPAIARLSVAAGPNEWKVEDERGRPVDAWRSPNGELLLVTDMEPKSQRQFCVGLRPRRDASSAEQFGRLESLVGHPANLVKNGNMESGDPPVFWLAPDLKSVPGMTARICDDARYGKTSLELQVPHDQRPNWIGWHSPSIPVRPAATYYLGTWLKSMGLRGTSAIHIHFHNASGGLTQSGAMASTQPNVSGDCDWTHSSALLVAPPDAASLVLHLTTNATGTIRYDGVVLAEASRGEIQDVRSWSTPRAGETLVAWNVNPLVKVFPETSPGSTPEELSVELARNECEPLQLAMRCGGNSRRHVTVEVTALAGPNGRDLPQVKVDRVGYVPIDHPSGYYRSDVPAWCRKVPIGDGATDGWAGWWPDPLAPATQFDVEPGRTQLLWLTVRAPGDAPSGEYRGTLTVRDQDRNELRVPLRVQVLPFALPARSSLRAILDFRFGPGGTMESGADSKDDRQRWLRFIAEHRLGIDAIVPPRFAWKDGAVTMDATEFDEDARFCFDELGMNVAYTPWFFYMFGWAYPPKKMFDFEPFTPEWQTALEQSYRLFSKHIREKGWHDRFVYYISDEPHFDHAFVVKQMQKLCEIIHRVDPEIPIYSSTWRHCAEWNESLDIWGVGQYGCFPVDEMRRQVDAGKQIWFTCDGQMATDTPLLATERMLPYYCRKYGATGYEFWGLAWWTYDPWQRGWHTFIRQSDDGKQHYWVRYPDGDGFLAYPGKPVGVQGPVSTIRLEQIREGLEDYEAMRILSGLVEKAKRDEPARESARRALKMADDLVSIPNSGGLRSSEILPDPDRIPAIRHAVNQAIIQLLPLATESR